MAPKVRDLAATFKKGGLRKRKAGTSSVAAGVEEPPATVAPVEEGSSADIPLPTANLVDLTESSEPVEPLKRRKRDAHDLPESSPGPSAVPDPTVGDAGEGQEPLEFVVHPKVHGRAMNTGDSVLKDAFAALGLLQAGMPPGDVKDLQKDSAEDHLVGAVHSSILGAARSLAALHHFSGLREHNAELQKKYDQLKDRYRESERGVKGLFYELKACKGVLTKTQACVKEKEAEVADMKAEAAAQSANFSELEKSAAEARKSASEAQASLAEARTSLEGMKAELSAQYDKGFEDAGDSYEAQVKEISEIVFGEGWRAALRRQKLDKSSSLWEDVPLRADADLGSDADEEGEQDAAEVPPPPADVAASELPPAEVLSEVSVDPPGVLVAEVPAEAPTDPPPGAPADAPSDAGLEAN